MTHKNKQPNSAHCFVCGLQNTFGLQLDFYDNGVDEVICHYTVPEKFNGYPGVAHGGIVAAMMDEVTIRTAIIADYSRMMMTAKIELKYRQHVPVETPLLLKGKLTRDRGRVATATGQLLLPDGSVAVEATTTMVQNTELSTAPQEMLDELGWKVY